MKLKKIASLMLAGVMAVSMLSACGEGSGNGNGNEDENKPVETVSNAVTYANDLLSSDLKEYMNFTNSSTLDGWMKAIATDTDKFSATEIKKVYTSLTTLVNKASKMQGYVKDMQDKLRSNLRDSNVLLADNDFKSVPADEKAQSQGWIYVLSGKLDEKSAVELAADDIKTWAVDSKNAPEMLDNNKYNCDYSIEISAVKVTNDSLSGESAWAIGVVINQTVTKAANVQV